MSLKIKRHLQAQYPELSDVFDQLKTIPEIRRRDMPLPEAVVRVVTGQMLAGPVARAIYERITVMAVEQRLLGSWLLDFDSLRNCGLSGSKARTICEMGSHVGSDITRLDHWYNLPAEDLIDEIKVYRGMGDWTASIIALAYVGHEDIFPSTDGSLQRAIRIIQTQTKGRKQRPLDPEKAAPYRSYLALYLWSALDTGAIAQR